MTDKKNIYPGDLEPIPYSKDCESIYKQRLQDLCECLNVPYSEPPTIENAQALAQQLIKKVVPYWEMELKRSIPYLTVDELNDLVFKLLAQLPGMRIEQPPQSQKTGRPPGSKKKRPEQDLIAFSLMERVRPLDKYRWGATERAKKILKENSWIKMGGNKPAESLDSQCREDRAKMGKEQRVLDETFQERASRTPEPSSETALKIGRAKELTDLLNAAKNNGDNKAAESLQIELKALIEQVLEGPDGQQFFDLFCWEITNKMLQGAVLEQKLFTK